MFPLKYYRSSGNDGNGFTLIEVTVTLSIVSLCVLFFSLAITQIKTVRGTVKDDRQIEWHTFLNQLEYDFSDSEFIGSTSSKVTIRKLDTETGYYDTITYERHFKNLIRQVGGKGHQPMLTELASITFEDNADQLKITAGFLNSERYSGKLRIKRAAP